MDIVDRLRKVARCLDWADQKEPIHEAADEITRLRKQVATLTAQRDQLLADEKESDAVRDRLAKLLSETAIALNGEEEALTRHSWHDLPVLALAAKVEAELMKQQRDLAAPIMRRINEQDADCDFLDVELSDALIEALAAIQSSEVTK